MYVSFYSGVVLFVGGAKRRIEGPRSYFKVAASNCGFYRQSCVSAYYSGDGDAEV